jgi:hypothetical protein
MENMFVAFNKRLNAISLEEDNILKREKRSIELCIVTLMELKAKTVKAGFTSRQEEIDFFKNIKPRFESQLKYHAALFEIERSKPPGSIQVQRKYFEKKLKEIYDFIQSDIEFYTYYKTGSTHFDELYFMRCSCSLQLQCSVFDIDMNFRTTHDNKVSQILASDELTAYLNNELNRLENNTPVETQIQRASKHQLKWTDSKVALIELIYALHSSGSLNKGVLDLKELTLALSGMLNIELGDVYRTWSEIKLRKIPTRYLDTLKVNLENRIVVDDLR